MAGGVWGEAGGIGAGSGHGLGEKITEELGHQVIRFLPVLSPTCGVTWGQLLFNVLKSETVSSLLYGDLFVNETHQPWG